MPKILIEVGMSRLTGLSNPIAMTSFHENPCNGLNGASPAQVQSKSASALLMNDPEIRKHLDLIDALRSFELAEEGIQFPVGLQRGPMHFLHRCYNPHIF